MHILSKLYDEIGDRGVSSLLHLHRSCDAQQISNEQVIRYITIYGNDLSLVKRQYDEVGVGLQGLLSQRHRTEKELENLNASVGYSFDMLKSIQAQCAEAEKTRNELFRQKVRLHVFVSQFKNNKGMCLKLGRFVQEKVNMILGNNMKLLELSLISALKSFKDDPNTCRYLLQKSELTAPSELIASMPNSSVLIPANNNPVSYSYNHGPKYHTQKQKPYQDLAACFV
ncbi:MAG: hypothetical protein WBX01_03225 [Nitrososphaeraceae archaeon]